MSGSVLKFLGLFFVLVFGAGVYMLFFKMPGGTAKKTFNVARWSLEDRSRPFKVNRFLDQALINNETDISRIKTHPCKDQITFLLSTDLGNILSSATYDQLSSTACNNFIKNRFPENDTKIHLMQCLTDRKLFYKKRCLPSITYMRTFAVDIFYYKLPLKFKNIAREKEIKQLAIHLQKMIWRTQMNSEQSTVEAKKHVDILTQLIHRYPNFYGLYKLKLINMAIMELHSGKRYISDEFHKFAQSNRGFDNDNDIEKIRAVLEIFIRQHNDEGIRIYIDSIFLGHEDTPEPYYFLAGHQWLIKKNKKEAMKWLKTGLRIARQDSLIAKKLKKALNDLKKARKNETIFTFDISYPVLKN